ncbi:MAG: magnesium transporter [Bacilli bacterium]|nr:magnesium transporter [Bacilli bacterium]
MEEIEIEELREQLLTAIQKRDRQKVIEIFDTVPNIDIAEAIEDVDDVKALLYIFKVVDNEYAAEFFAELSSDQQELIINAFSDKELVELINESYADDITDAIQQLPANIVNRVLKVCPKEMRNDVNKLLNYKEDTAGSVMTTEYIEMKEDTSVKDAIKIIREKGRDAETVYTIFVRDTKRTLTGTVDLDDLIFAKEDEILSDIMNRDFVSCNVNNDQEDVAKMFKRYDLTAMAVTNDENKIVGIITIDDVVDIIEEEVTEDIARMAAISDMSDPYLKTPVYKLVLKCVPWIIALMVLQVFSTLILSGFEAEIGKFAILAVFTPLIMDAGGNSGGQTTTMIVRSLSLDEFDKKDYWKVAWKELRVAAVIGGIVSLFAFGWLMFEMSVGIVDTKSISDVTPLVVKGELLIAALVAGTLFVTMIISRMVGCSLPFLAKLIKLDPAVVCGPFTTTIVDIVSLITYFLIWTQLINPAFFGL